MIQDTSLLSWVEVTIDLGERQYQVLRAIRTLGQASNSEIARLLEWSINRVTPRVYELRDAKHGGHHALIRDAGVRTCMVTHRMVHTWEEIPKQEW